MNALHRVLLVMTIPILLGAMDTAEDGTIYGTWQFNEDESTDIVGWRYRVPQLRIRQVGGAVAIEHDWRRGRQSWCDSFTIHPGREPVTKTVEAPIWPANWFMGVLARVGGEMTTKATWLEADRRLMTEIEQVVEVSQGQATIVSTRVYAVDRQGDTLTLTEKRSTRPTPVRLVFDRVAGGTIE